MKLKLWKPIYKQGYVKKMSYWTKILISVSSEDKGIEEFLNQKFGHINKLEIDCHSILFYLDTKRLGLWDDFIWELRNLEIKSPESLQVFFQGEDDFKYRTVDIHPEIQEKLDLEEGRTPDTYPFYFNQNIIEEAKPENWDNEEIEVLPNKAGWVKCPGCEISFKRYDKNVFKNSRHYCGQKIKIGTT